MKLVLFDSSLRKYLSPFSSVRPVSELRAGAFTFRERWEKIFGLESTILTAGYLQEKFPFEPDQDNLFVNAHILNIDSGLVQQIKNLNTGEALAHGEQLVAARNPSINITDYSTIKPSLFKNTVQLEKGINWLKYPWQLFEENDRLIRFDFEWILNNSSRAPISKTNHLVKEKDIFIEAGAKVEHCYINASAGPVYIGQHCLVMEGSMIRGPFVMCEGSVLKMGAKIYGATTLGPHCIGGGEIKNSIMHGYSNKAHDGYLGDSVIGEWCNIGAGTSNSNIKNTASLVKIWNEEENDFVEAGIKCGLIMGDYSRCAINTSFNTGTVVGICVNIFGESFPAKILSNFMWGNTENRYEINKAFADIDNWMKLKGKTLSDADKKILQFIFEP